MSEPLVVLSSIIESVEVGIEAEPAVNTRRCTCYLKGS